MDYPGILEPGAAEDASVDALRQRLRDLGYAAPARGDFDEKLAAFVSLFQSQHVDLAGRPLKVDGKVGPNTWAALFGHASTGSLLSKALAIAQSQIGVREQPPGSNSGPQVDAYLRSAGGAPGEPWCMSFVYWCFQQAAAPTASPVPRSPGVLDVFHRVQHASPAAIIPRSAALADPEIIEPGWVFILDHGHGLGHTGIVKGAIAGALVTIEGNTNNTLSREGLGVFELTRRSTGDSELVGYVDFSRY